MDWIFAGEEEDGGIVWKVFLRYCLEANSPSLFYVGEYFFKGP